MTNLKGSTVKVKTIGDAVFAATGMGHYDFDEAGITETPQFMFFNATKLVSVKGNNVISIGANAFNGTAITDLDLPALKTIEANAFNEILH